MVKSGTDLSVPETTQIGLEPTASAVTGRRSNQLSHWAMYPENRIRKIVILQNKVPLSKTVLRGSHSANASSFYLRFAKCSAQDKPATD